MDSDSVTLAAANATKSALGTVKLVNGFFNPLTSGKNCVIIAAHVATVSGTPAGPYFWNFINGVTVNSAATGTIRSALLGSVYTSVVTPQVNVAVTVIGGATTALTQFSVMGGPAAIAAGAGLYDAYDEVDGGIVVPPGTLVGITATGAGKSHVVQSTIRWKEVNVIP